MVTGTVSGHTGTGTGTLFGDLGIHFNRGAEVQAGGTFQNWKILLLLVFLLFLNENIIEMLDVFPFDFFFRVFLPRFLRRFLFLLHFLL